jgi:hypothetical protein
LRRSSTSSAGNYPISLQPAITDLEAIVRQRLQLERQTPAASGHALLAAVPRAGVVRDAESSAAFTW